MYRNHHLDSTRWGQVPYRADDIIITTPYKTGTTWMQEIVGRLLHGPEAEIDRHQLSPWICARFWGPIGPIAEEVNEQPHRRYLKSHLPLDGMRWHGQVSFVVVGRDLRDTFMSLVNHWSAYTDLAFGAVNDDACPGLPLPRFDGDVHAFWRRWITEGWFEWERDGWPFWSASHHLATWWAVRDQPNVTLVHHADLLADPVGEIARIAARAGIDADEDVIAAVADRTSFSTMKARMLRDSPPGDDSTEFFSGGAGTFMHKGTNGRWRDVLNDDELALYEKRARQLDPQLRAWLEGGRHVAEMD